MKLSANPVRGDRSWQPGLASWVGCLGVVATLALVRPVACLAQIGPLCAQPDAPTISRLLHVAARAFRTEPVFPSIDEQELVAGTCYWKFSLSVPDGNARWTLYLSPDKRFVSTRIWDLSASPDAEDAQAAAELKLDAEKEHAPAEGPTAAPIMVVAFSDFECQFCAGFANMVQDYRKTNPDRIQFIFRNSPLTTHRWAVPAAQAGICIARQSPGAFWKFHDLVFSQQKNLTGESLLSTVHDFIAMTPEVHAAEYSDCMESPYPQARLDQDVAEARKYDVHGTPTVFVNGHRYAGFRDEEDFARAVNLAAKIGIPRQGGSK
ncbi:MAG: DsbA family protein [Terriglobia bacterium]